MKAVVITGVTRGLGRAMASGFAAAGWRVCGCGRSQEAIAELADDPGEPHLFRVVDVTDARAVGAFADEVMETLGHAPDWVLNNAALINPNAPLWEVPVDEFSRVIDVNIKGVFHGVRAFLPGMIARGSGVMVNLSSGWGRGVSPEVAPYCATKWAVEGMTSALAQELPPGLAAVALNPGVIDTEMLRSCFGVGAGSYPGPEAWAQNAVPFLIGLGPKDNGKALSAP